jgi:P-type conjugative transfer protein TrbJ
MTRSRIFRAALASVGVLSLILAQATPSQAQITVFDPANYAQSVLTAARELQQVNNQIQQIENQTTSLINQAKNLASLPYSMVATITGQIQKTEQLLAQAQKIAYSVTTINQAFTTNYGAINLSLSDQQMIAQAKSRWQTSVAGYQDAMNIQAGVVTNITTSRTTMNGLATASQSATGALQAAQATNQLLGLVSQQLADLIAVMAAQSRAQSLSAAAEATNQDQAATQLSRFLTPGPAYTPTTITMFH